jgi:ABC-2 type transport system permease protein
MVFEGINTLCWGALGWLLVSLAGAGSGAKGWMAMAAAGVLAASLLTLLLAWLIPRRPART